MSDSIVLKGNRAHGPVYPVSLFPCIICCQGHDNIRIVKGGLKLYEIFRMRDR